MGNTLVTAVIGIGEKCLPAGKQSFSVNVVSVILGSNVTFSGLVVQHGLILSTVSEWQFFGLSSGRQTDQLISHANTVNGLDFTVGTGHDLSQFLDSGATHIGVTRSVGQKETIVFVHVRSEWIVPWHHGQFHITLAELTDNVVLHTHIDGQNLVLVALSVHDG